jgi:hypothetical protein
MTKRDIDLGVKINQEEEKKILAKAKILGMNKSEFVRFICLNAKVEISSQD